VRRWRLAAASMVGALVALAATAPAEASCVRPPASSPHAFVGTVIATEEEGRIATVVTDSGRRVEVRGTSDTSWWTESFSYVDRRYALGARYEFHPTTARPYQDNVCTATHKLAGPRLPPLLPAEEFLPGWLPVDEQAGPIGYLLFFGPVLVGVACLALVPRLLLGRRQRGGSIRR